MSKSNQQLFTFGNSQVRTVLDDSGEVWFVAKDVCDVVEISDVSQACDRLDDDEKLMRTIHASGQNRDMITVNESGLYVLIMKSRKPEAKAFRKWVTKEVLPTIRKTGSYTITNKIQTLEVRLDVINSYYLAMALGCEMGHEGVRREAQRITEYFGSRYVSGDYPQGTMVKGYGKVHELPWREARIYLGLYYHEAKHLGKSKDLPKDLPKDKSEDNFSDILERLEQASQLVDRQPRTFSAVNTLLSSQFGVTLDA